MGNVTTDARSFSGVTGDPGTNTNTFTYDPLDRLSSETGLATSCAVKTYSYDLDSNRVGMVAGSVTYSSTFDQTDELVTVQKTGGTTQYFGYDRYGNLTGDAESAANVTTMAYDLGDKLTSITPSGGSATTLTYDALARPWTRAVPGSGTDTYSYRGPLDGGCDRPRARRRGRRSVGHMLGTRNLAISIDRVLAANQSPGVLIDPFVSQWFDASGGDLGYPPEELAFHKALPFWLIRFYEIAGRHFGTAHTQDRLLAPSELRPSGEWLPFWSESQGVVDWAFRLSDRDSKDPPVFVSDPDDSHRPPADRAWHQENTHLGEFMFQMLVYQRTVSTPLGAFGWLTEGTSARALGFERIHLPVWTWPQPRSELFASDGVLAVSIASNPIQLFVAALDLGKLRQVLRRPGVHWETQIGT